MSAITASTKRTPAGHIFGMRAGWLTGDGEGATFTLDHNAGLGGASLMLTLTLADGRAIRETLDVEDLTKSWVAAILIEESDTKE